jgi:hypothetical protein
MLLRPSAYFSAEVASLAESAVALNWPAAAGASWACGTAPRLGVWGGGAVRRRLGPQDRADPGELSGGAAWLRSGPR